MKPSDLVAGRFEISECVGSGTCGAVYRAWDRVLEREVAIKQLDCATDERVMQTSRAAARLNHPSIVPLFEVGETEQGAFLVSEFIDGLTLRKARAEGLLTDRDVAEIGADLCAGLHHAAERGVVHGDVKPENVIVRTRDENPDQRSGRCQAKLRDFATREILAEPHENQSRSPYLAPEQLGGCGPTHATDVYAVALLLFECWTGHNPLAATGRAPTPSPHAERFPSVASLRPDLPQRLAMVIDSALDPDPSARPTPLDLHEWLDHVFDDLDCEGSLPAPRAPLQSPQEPSSGAGALAAAATVAAAVGVCLAGAAPAAFALACWPARPLRRAALAVVATFAVLLGAALVDPSRAPVALEAGAGVAGALSAPYAIPVAMLWAAAAVVLGALARAPSPVSGAALATAFSLAALVATEALARVSQEASLGSLPPMVGVAGLALVASVALSRRAAGQLIAGRVEPEEVGGVPQVAGLPLDPPEPREGELVLSTSAASPAARDLPAARVP